jgi:hypothetical protein
LVRLFVGRTGEDTKDFNIVIVFVAAEKYEIIGCLVASEWDGYDNY